ncbi:MAG: SUMF1/EgtB/PvdO family nonheme iron enzyme [Polyangiaceae bacterium]
MAKTRRPSRTTVVVATSAFVASLATWVGYRWLEARNPAITIALRNALGVPPEPRFQWRSIDGKYWQVLGATAPIEADDSEGDVAAGCPRGMIRVKGRFKLDTYRSESSEEVERLQNDACTNWISRDFPARCAEFDRDKWLALSASLPTKPMDFCVDRFEYPNKRGENPIIVVTHVEAKGLCSAQGKRLCTETEWTFACEGEEATPYPYGYVRDAEACVVDQPWVPFVEGALSDRKSDNARAELDRLWQGRPSGSKPKCKSPFGVHDMTGNVDEWTQSVRKTGFASILKGGYWGPVRARCRPSTRAHGEQFVAYQQSLRCCSGPGTGSELAAPRTSKLPDTHPVPDAGSVDASTTDSGESLSKDAEAPAEDGAVNVGAAAVAPSAAPSDPPVRAPFSIADVPIPSTSDELEALANTFKSSTCAASPGPATSASFAVVAWAAVGAAFIRRRTRVRAGYPARPRSRRASGT